MSKIIQVIQNLFLFIVIFMDLEEESGFLCSDFFGMKNTDKKADVNE